MREYVRWEGGSQSGEDLYYALVPEIGPLSGWPLSQSGYACHRSQHGRNGSLLAKEGAPSCGHLLHHKIHSSGTRTAVALEIPSLRERFVRSVRPIGMIRIPFDGVARAQEPSERGARPGHA